MLRKGDTLVVWKLDRLSRSVKHLVDLVGELQKQGVKFRSFTDSIDTRTPSGRFFFHVMASQLCSLVEVFFLGSLEDYGLGDCADVHLSVWGGGQGGLRCSLG